jgi:hypothetical protein
MFPPRLQRIVDGLAELADAMLRPSDEVGPHPHREPLRSSRPRRLGAPAAQPQACVSPLAPQRDRPRARTQRTPAG